MEAETSNRPMYEVPVDDGAFRERYGDLAGMGQSAVIYSRDGVVAKVYRDHQPRTDAFMEAFHLAKVGDLGIPVPKVYGVETFQGRTVVLMDQVRGKALHELDGGDPERMGGSIDKVVEMQVAMHRTFVTNFVSLKADLGGKILSSPALSADEKDRLGAMLVDLPDGSVICHGDFHGGNILYDGATYKIIDWMEVTCGSPAGDACRTYMDYSMLWKDVAEQYLRKYCAASGLSRSDILAWLPVTAGSLYGYIAEAWRKELRPLF
ncbi:MAG TPA: phosphotransferase [Holophaga sp.]|nr:phosphotransferase [Holophaga sp.]